MAGLLGRLKLDLPNGQERYGLFKQCFLPMASHTIFIPFRSDQISDKPIDIIDDKMINVEYDSDNSLDDVSTDLPSETVEANGVYYVSVSYFAINNAS